MDYDTRSNKYVGNIYKIDEMGIIQIMDYDWDHHKGRAEIKIKWLFSDPAQSKKEAYWVNFNYYQKWLTKPLPKDSAWYILYSCEQL